MTRPPQDIILALARMSNTIAPWLQEWRQKEMDQLLFTSPANVGIAQGRCQVFTELCKLVQDSPDMAAQPRKG